MFFKLLSLSEKNGVPHWQPWADSCRRQSKLSCPQTKKRLHTSAGDSSCLHKGAANSSHAHWHWKSILFSLSLHKVRTHPQLHRPEQIPTMSVVLFSRSYCPFPRISQGGLSKNPHWCGMIEGLPPYAKPHESLVNGLHFFLLSKVELKNSR